MAIGPSSRCPICPCWRCASTLSTIGQGDLSVGMPAAVSLVGRPGVELKGRIRQLPAIGVLATVAQDKSLHIALEDPGISANYVSGDLARAALVLERKQDVLWLPPVGPSHIRGPEVRRRSGERRPTACRCQGGHRRRRSHRNRQRSDRRSDHRRAVGAEPVMGVLLRFGAIFIRSSQAALLAA